MNDDDLKKIRSIVKEELDLGLEPIKKTLEQHGEILEEHTKKIDGIIDQLADVSEDVTEIKETLKSHTIRVTAIEDHIGFSAPGE